MVLRLDIFSVTAWDSGVSLVGFVFTEAAFRTQDRHGTTARDGKHSVLLRMLAFLNETLHEHDF